MFADQIDQIDRLMTLPQVVFQINELVESKTASAADLHRVIKADPALSARLLKLVNSAYYGLPGTVGSLEKAVILLGVTAVRNLAIATGIEQLFRRAKIKGAFNGRDLWMHCLAVSAAARCLCERMSVRRMDEVFMAGLMHDLGLLAAAQVVPEDFNRVVEAVGSSEQAWDTVEMEIFGIDHAAAGAQLAERWHFPADLVGMIAQHHQWTDKQTRAAELGRIIYMADTLAGHMTEGFRLTAQHQVCTDEMLVASGVGQDDLREVWQELPSHMGELAGILRV